MTAFLNGLIKQAANLVNMVLMLLPDTPFEWEWVKSMTNSEYWAFANYFIPFDVILTISLAYVSGVAIWYGVRWLLRFVQYIQ